MDHGALAIAALTTLTLAWFYVVSTALLLCESVAPSATASHFPHLRQYRVWEPTQMWPTARHFTYLKIHIAMLLKTKMGLRLLLV
jgi:hypothetical protein